MANISLIFKVFISLLIYFCDANSCPNGALSCTDKNSLTPKSEETTMNHIFNCTAKGRFAHMNTDCKKYILCSISNSGFIGSEYSCPDGFLFNPEIQQCTKNYICTDVDTNEKLINCTTIGKFAFDTEESNCSKYLECETVDGMHFNNRINICKNATKFNPVLQECGEEYSCPTLSSESLGNFRTKRETVTLSPRFLVDGRCTTIGRYQIDNSNCKKYAYCSALPNGTLQSTIFTCPTTTVFNQPIQKCTSRYQCPDTLCFSLLQIPNPNTPDCSSYIECNNINSVTGDMNGFKGTVRYCKLGYKYDPMLPGCSDTYKCPTA